MNRMALETYVCGYCAAEVPLATCPRCGHFGPVRDFPTRETLTIREQNDRFREGLIWCASPVLGSVVVTSGVRERERDFETEAYLAVAFDTAFTEDNDPWGIRDFGTVTVQGEKLYWKIDYYDAARDYGSGDPADPAKTHRVLTILFPPNTDRTGPPRPPRGAGHPKRKTITVAHKETRHVQCDCPAPRGPRRWRPPTSLPMRPCWATRTCWTGCSARS